MTRKEINPEIKAKAVLELMTGERMLSEVANSYGIVPRTLENWRKEFLDNAHRAFTLSKDEKALEQERKDAYIQEKALMQKIGQLTVELDWCKKKVKEARFMGKKGTSNDR